MPIVPKDKVAPHEIYGIDKVDNMLSMRERIKKRFRPSDTVEVRNVTNQAIEWQWLNEEDETYAIEDDTNIKITEREDPGLWRLDGGENDVLPGGCAYLMIEALYKLVCVMKIGIVLHPLDEREVRNFSFDDPQRQEQFIDAVFVGKLTPQMMQQAAVSQLTTTDSGVTENLPALDTEQSEWQRRKGSETRRATPAHVIGEHKELSDLANEFDPGDTLLGTATGGLPTDRQVPAPISEDQPDETEAPDQPTEPPAAPPKEPAQKTAPAKPVAKKEPVKV